MKTNLRWCGFESENISGDSLTIEIEGIGTISNPVEDEAEL